MIRRRSMTEDDEMKDFKEVASGSLTTLTTDTPTLDIAVNGLSEFYLVISGIRSDNADDLYATTGDSYLNISLNGTPVNLTTRFGSHNWGFKFYWHCVKAADDWFCEASANANSTIQTSLTYTPKLRPIPITADVCNKITITLLGTANVANGTYRIIGR